MKKLFLSAVMFLLFCSSAWATQEHTAPEGLYSHQAAHLFFIFAMVVLIVQIKRTSPLPKGWKHIGIAAFLFALWNVNVFTVHWIRETLPPELFTGSAQGWSWQMDISSLRGKIFYAGKILDHFLAVGAVAAFLMGIKTFKEEVYWEKR